MGLWDAVTRFFALEEPTQTRSLERVDLPLDNQLRALRGRLGQPWRVATTEEALGVPAVLRAVSLISNTAGAMSMEAFRNGEVMVERPKLIVRPNPLTTPRDFYRDTAYSMATYGEAWWWIAKRDFDGLALSLIPLDPVEVIVTANNRNPLRPEVKWRNQIMRNEDMVQITLLRHPGELRGYGPLQKCGAAVSVAVEAQEWAANFYAEGGYPSIALQSEFDLNEEEADLLKQRWVATPPNTPKVTSAGLTIKEMEVNQQGGQMLQARLHQNGEVALMFGVPGPLLEYSAPGSSLTYRNIPDLMRQFYGTCLWPYYLEPIEQAMSDLLPRTTAARFNTDALLRPDPKERYEIHKLAIDTGVYDADHAQQLEGIQPGDVERAPVPFSPPQAIPTSIPTRSSEPIRCDACGRSRMIVFGGGAMRCVNCKAERLIA